MFQWVGWAIKGFIMSRVSLVAENLCLRQQLLVLQRRHPRPRLRDADRRFWILAYDLGERVGGPAEDPSGAGEAGVQSLCSNRCQVHASAAWARAGAGVADLSQTARWRNLSLRLHQRADDSLQDTPCFLRDSPRQPRSRACPGNPTSNGRVGGAADRRMLRLGP